MMTSTEAMQHRLDEAEATIKALLSGQIDAVVDPATSTPILLSEAQIALRRSEDRYRRIVEATIEGIVEIDDHGTIVFANERFAEMLGVARADVLGKEVTSFMSAESREISRAGQLRRRQGLKEELRLDFLANDGRNISVTMACSPVFGEDGRYTGAFALLRDVTEEQNIAAQLMLSDRMASVGTLAAGVAHEINNPMTVVIANLSFLSDSLKDTLSYADLIDPLVDACEAAQRVRIIVRDLKLFSRTPDELRTMVDVRMTIASSLRMAATEIRHRARLVECFGDVPLIAANEARLGQVFLNLIVNAAQAIPAGNFAGNEIRVVTRTEGDRVIVEVRDTGEGIPPAIIGRIFDAFYTTKPPGVGTGLGLSISHRILSAMGGCLTVESAVGHGSTFRVSLPIGGECEAPVAIPQKLARISGPRRRILVIDDEDTILHIMRSILGPDYDVVTALTGENALRLFELGEAFDLIVCDLMMPNITGMDLHRELSRVAPDQAGRMLFVTGGACTPEAGAFLERQVSLAKPFTADELRAAVDQRFA